MLLALRSLWEAGAPAVTGTGAVTFQKPALDGSALEKFAATGAETFAHPALASSGAEKFTGSGAEAFGHPLLSASASEKFLGTGAEAFGAPALAGTGTAGTVSITGTGAIAFAVPGLLGGVADVPQGSSEGGGIGPRFGIRITPRSQSRPLRRPARPRPQRRPLVVAAPEIDDTDALVALYAAGAIDLEEFAALIAA